MTISYNWLSEYLPIKIDAERLSKILTSIGLEVEKMSNYEEIKGGLKGLVIGEVLQTEKHPNADKLTLTKVDIGKGDPLNIVCGAPNVASGQKVIVAPVNTTIYPMSGDPLTMRVAKIRGEESHGMICAEDEIGLGESHDGIIVLPPDLKPGTSAASYFQPYTDVIYEIGLTPNRMDAMSHWGVARDVCAYLSYHDKKEYKPLLPVSNFKSDKKLLDISVIVEDSEACPRYSGVCIANVTIAESPKWLQQKLKSIGLRPINNIVDITNFIQHETGQPLHAFDYDKITGKKVIIKKLPANSLFTTLDEKQRKLSEEDLMICSETEPMCIAGVFGGINSGVTDQTKNIFLESAFFNPISIRRTSFRHGLRTDAATRFEKGIDISNTVNVLKRATMLITELAGGTVASDIIDVYPDPEPKKEVILKYQYLKKLSGKNYHPESIKTILQSLSFGIIKEGMDAISVEVPYHKRDASLPADIVEEIVRIDGLDNIDIPSSITISPSINENALEEELKEKLSTLITGFSITEILTNSITNSKYFPADHYPTTVKLLNNLSVELDVLRPSMLQTALEVVSFNLNRKNHDLKLFEFGKTYSSVATGKYTEQNHLCIYTTGKSNPTHWKEKSGNSDIYHLKGIVASILQSVNFKAESFEQQPSDHEMEYSLTINVNNQTLIKLGKVSDALLRSFDIKQPVYYADFNWDLLLKQVDTNIKVKEISKYPAVERDLAMVVPKHMKYIDIRKQISGLKLQKLKNISLFDIFESEKLGKDKKSLAVNFTFLDEEKTLTDKEIDGWMTKIMTTLEKELNAEIRK